MLPFHLLYWPTFVEWLQCVSLKAILHIRYFIIITIYMRKLRLRLINKLTQRHKSWEIVEVHSIPSGSRAQVPSRYIMLLLSVPELKENKVVKQ